MFCVFCKTWLCVCSSFHGGTEEGHGASLRSARRGGNSLVNARNLGGTRPSLCGWMDMIWRYSYRQVFRRMWNFLENFLRSGERTSCVENLCIYVCCMMMISGSRKVEIWSLGAVVVMEKPVARDQVGPCDHYGRRNCHE